MGLFLCSLIVLVFAHYYIFSDGRKIANTVDQVVTMTQMASLSLGAAYYEPRVERVQKVGNPAYPEMMPLSRMDFVYAR